MTNRCWETVAKYHYHRIQTVISQSDWRKQKFAITTGADRQAVMLMLALDIRRLAEVIAVWDSWEESYSDNGDLFRHVAMNDLLDVLGRMKALVGQWPLDESFRVSSDGQQTSDLFQAIPPKRFKKKYGGVGGVTNEQMRRNASPDLQAIFFTTSKLLHADEYGVFAHCTNDSLAWTALVMAGDLACSIYRSRCPNI